MGLGGIAMKKITLPNSKLLGLGVFGVALMIIGSLITKSPEPPKPVHTNSDKIPIKVEQQTGMRYEEMLESKLANLLSQVKGAGAVSINVTLETGGYQEHAKNIVKENKIIQEKDNAGGTRTTTETKESEHVLLSKENGVDRPVIVQETKPVIKGILVIAEGANDSVVKANLTKAVSSGLGLPVYKITVLPQRR